MNQEEKNRPYYEVEVGTPTLTIEHDGGRTMLPYSSLEAAELHEDGSLMIFFASWMVEVRGELPQELWDSLQLFDLRVLRMVEQKDEDGCFIQHLSMLSRVPAE